MKQQYVGKKPPLHLCKLVTFSIFLPQLFTNLINYCGPVATKSRKYNSSDKNITVSEAAICKSDN